MSIIENVFAEKNEVLMGGKMISVMTGSLILKNSRFTKNYIYQDTEGIQGISANLTIEDCTFSQ